MNYRHAFHAGNFADVLKHVVLALVLQHLRLKPAPFRVIDTHAGIARYDLESEEATRTGEWRDGIGRLLAAPLSDATRTVIAPYLDAVRAVNAGCLASGLRAYPGSPQIARHFMRADDVLVANELHVEDRAVLQGHFARDRQVKVMGLDGYTALKALLPPKERRGLVLVDPPFEQAGEFERLLKAMSYAHERFATGTLILWYPIKDRAAVARFEDDIAAAGLSKTLRAELQVCDAFLPDAGGAPRRGLAATAVAVVNPPYTLAPALQQILPELTTVLAQGPGAASRLDWLVAERVHG